MSILAWNYECKEIIIKFPLEPEEELVIFVSINTSYLNTSVSRRLLKQKDTYKWLHKSVRQICYSRKQELPN